jgi:hypothetical protein
MGKVGGGTVVGTGELARVAGWFGWVGELDMIVSDRWKIGRWGREGRWCCQIAGAWKPLARLQGRRSLISSFAENSA